MNKYRYGQVTRLNVLHKTCYFSQHGKWPNSALIPEKIERQPWQHRDSTFLRKQKERKEKKGKNIYEREICNKSIHLHKLSKFFTRYLTIAFYYLFFFLWVLFTKEIMHEINLTLHFFFFFLFLKKFFFDFPGSFLPKKKGREMLFSKVFILSLSAFVFVLPTTNGVSSENGLDNNVKDAVPPSLVYVMYFFFLRVKVGSHHDNAWNISDAILPKKVYTSRTFFFHLFCFSFESESSILTAMWKMVTRSTVY